jgi:hypothetical protein
MSINHDKKNLSLSESKSESKKSTPQFTRQPILYRTIYLLEGVTYQMKLFDNVCWKKTTKTTKKKCSKKCNIRIDRLFYVSIFLMFCGKKKLLLLTSFEKEKNVAANFSRTEKKWWRGKVIEFARIRVTKSWTLH